MADIAMNVELNAMVDQVGVAMDGWVNAYCAGECAEADELRACRQ